MQSNFALSLDASCLGVCSPSYLWGGICRYLPFDKRGLWYPILAPRIIIQLGRDGRLNYLFGDVDVIEVECVLRPRDFSDLDLCCPCYLSQLDLFSVQLAFTFAISEPMNHTH